MRRAGRRSIAAGVSATANRRAAAGPVVVSCVRSDRMQATRTRNGLLLGDQREGRAVPARLRPLQAADDAGDVYRLSLIDSRRARARGTSLAVQSATTLGARSSSTRVNCCRASAYRPPAI